MTGNKGFDWGQGDPDYPTVLAEEQAAGDAAELVFMALEARGMNQTQLAEAVGVTKGAMSQRLNGSNMTIHMLASMAHRLGYRLQLEFVDLNEGIILNPRSYSDGSVQRHKDEFSVAM